MHTGSSWGWSRLAISHDRTVVTHSNTTNSTAQSSTACNSRDSRSEHSSSSIVLRPRLLSLMNEGWLKTQLHVYYNLVVLCNWHNTRAYGDRGNWAIKVVCRRLGYAGLKPDHEKAVRSFVNNQDMFVSTIDRQRKVWMPVRLLRSLTDFFLCFAFRTSWGRQSLQRNVSW